MRWVHRLLRTVNNSLQLFFFTALIAPFAAAIPSLAVFRRHSLHGIQDARRSVSTCKHKLHVGSGYGSGIIGAMGVIYFLIGANVCCCAVVRKTMGKGNSVDKGHGIKKEAPTG